MTSYEEGSSSEKQYVFQEEVKEPKKPKKVVTSQPAKSCSSLEEFFKSYTGGQTEMDGKTFAKLAKDTSILNKVLTTTDIDLIFAKIKDKAARKITLVQF